LRLRLGGFWILDSGFRISRGLGANESRKQKADSGAPFSARELIENPKSKIQNSRGSGLTAKYGLVTRVRFGNTARRSCEIIARTKTGFTQRGKARQGRSEDKGVCFTCLCLSVSPCGLSCFDFFTAPFVLFASLRELFACPRVYSPPPVGQYPFAFRRQDR
jgi:hypothetical protein